MLVSETTSFNRLEGPRIAYYRPDNLSSQQFWDEHWSGLQHKLLKSFYASFFSGYLGHGVLAFVLVKHLPRAGRILEAGCGLAQHVVALRARGYDCVGVDFADETVRKVRSLLPDLPVEKGDILSLPLNAGSLSAYISLGVVEHFKEGPEAAIKEAGRVLRQGGLLVLSVPQAFNWRKQRANPQGTPVPGGFVFYQYAFHHGEVKDILLNEGFDVVSEYGYESHYALRLRFPWFKKALSLFPKLARMDLIIDRTPLGKKMGRMRLYVAKKL